MNGPGHYRQAERLLAQADRWESSVTDDTDSYAAIDAAIARALVHAELAKAAAAISAAGHPNQSQVDYLGEWWEVLS